jgi:hypothetical protein
MALGRYAERLRGRSDVRLWLVVNPYRPMTRDLAGLWEIRREMEAAAGLPFGGIVNCANLAGETTAETIAQSFGLLRALSQKMALPIVLTAVPAGLPLRLPPDMAGTRLEIQTRKTPGS